MRVELSELISAFRAHLSWRVAHGVRWAPAADSPRLGAVLPVEQRIEQRIEEQGEQQAEQQVEQQIEEQIEPGKPADLETLHGELKGCKRCRLADRRKHVVFGEGSATADLMFIGEAPGAEEDAQGRPFVGAAGQLLTRMIKAMGLEREEVYIGNIIKCRPPRNRDPNPDEIDACEPFLRQQIDAIGPRIIVGLGAFAARTLLRSDLSITRLRGRFHTYHGIALMPTFHPAYLLRNPGQKRPVWEDLQAVMAEMDRLDLWRRR